MFVFNFLDGDMVATSGVTLTFNLFENDLYLLEYPRKRV